jgi:pimeloyl-ACP methyl ester carboxylesterase
MSTDLFSAVAGDVDDLTLPLVVLCHGSMDRSAGMLRLSRQLDATAVVIRYDRRGYAKSSEVGSPYVLDEQIADLALVLDRHVPARSIDLAFGHSFGGNVVLGLAARRPELITRAVVYETPLSWFDWWPSSGAGGAAAQAATPEDAAEAFMRRLVGDERWERLPAGTRAGRRAEGVAMVGELNDLRRAPPWNADDVRCPVLAVGGEHGRAHHQRGMQLLADMLPSGTFARLDGAGHGAHNTHPTELAMLLREWLSRGVG